MVVLHSGLQARGSDVSCLALAKALRRRTVTSALTVSRLNHQPGLGRGWDSAPTELERSLGADSADTYPECMLQKPDGTLVHAAAELMPQPFMANVKEQSKRGGMEAQFWAAEGSEERPSTPFGQTVEDRSGVGLPRGEDELTREQANCATRNIGAELSAAAKVGVGSQAEADNARALACRFVGRHSGFGLLHLRMNAMAAISKSTYTADIFEVAPAHLAFSSIDWTKVQANHPGKRRFLRVMNTATATVIDDAFAGSPDRPQPPFSYNGTNILHVSAAHTLDMSKSTAPLAHPGRGSAHTPPGAVTVTVGGEQAVVLGWRRRRSDAFGDRSGNAPPPATTAAAMVYGKQDHALLIKAVKALRPGHPPVQLYVMRSQPAAQVAPWPSSIEVSRASQAYHHAYAVAMEEWLEGELLLDRAEHPAEMDPADPSSQLHPAGSNWSALVELYLSQTVWIDAGDIAMRGWAHDEMLAADKQVSRIFDEGLHPKYNQRTGLKSGAYAIQSQAHNEMVAATLGTCLVNDGSPMAPDAVQEVVVKTGKDMLPANLTADGASDAAEVALLNVDLHLAARDMTAKKRGDDRGAAATVNKSIVPEVDATMRLLTVARLTTRATGGNGLGISAVTAAVMAEHAAQGGGVGGFVGAEAEDVLKSPCLSPFDGTFGPVLERNPNGLFWFNGTGVGGAAPAELLGAVIKMAAPDGLESVTGYCPVKGPRPNARSEVWVSVGGANGRRLADVDISMANTQVANLMWTNGTLQTVTASSQPVRVKFVGGSDEYVLIDAYLAEEGPTPVALRPKGRNQKSVAQEVIRAAAADVVAVLHLRALVPASRMTEHGEPRTRTLRSVMDMPPGTKKKWRCTAFRPVGVKNGSPLQRADKTRAAKVTKVKQETKRREKRSTAEAAGIIPTPGPVPADLNPLSVPRVHDPTFEAVMSTFATTSNDKRSDNAVIGAEVKSVAKQSSITWVRRPTYGKALCAPGQFDCFEQVTPESKSRALKALVRLNKPGGGNDMERALNRIVAGTLVIPVRAVPAALDSVGVPAATAGGEPDLGAGAAAVEEQIARQRAHQLTIRKLAAARTTHLKITQLQQTAASETFADGASASVHTNAAFLARALLKSKRRVEEAAAAERAAMGLAEGAHADPHDV